jgi:hypothetical protein
LYRESASAGSRAAAAALAAQLRDLGLATRVEEERVHGTYWVPLGLLQALTLAAAVLPRRLGAALSALAALGVTDELWMGPRPLRRLLPQRVAMNVVAEAGPADAARTVVVHAHHDAAHSGLVFHPALARLAGRLLPSRRIPTTPPVLWTTLTAPLLALAGAASGLRWLRRLATFVGIAQLAALGDIARARVVPGACDNLSGVGALAAVAAGLATQPPSCRVVLLSTDSEESFLEGMQAFLRRHSDRLPRERTTFLCLESVGSGRLVLLDGEGMLRLHRYPPAPREELARAAGDLGIAVEPFRFRFATDGQLPLLAGYRTGVVASVDWYGAPRNYHWPSDDTGSVDLGTAERAAELVLSWLRGTSDSWRLSGG